MYNSTLKPNRCKCGCNHFPSISYDGWYAPHAPEEIKLKVGNKRKAAQKRKNERLSIARKAMVLPENLEMKNERDELEEYFRIAAMELSENPICEECGEYIPKTIRTVRAGKWVEIDNYRNCTAHIMFKKIFKSVSTNPNNRLFLCAKNGCHDKTHRMDTFSKMKCFPEAARKYELFKSQITETHKYKDIFEEYINQLNTK